MPAGSTVDETHQFWTIAERVIDQLRKRVAARPTGRPRRRREAILNPDTPIGYKGPA
jgi:hypothetical protein